MRGSVNDYFVIVGFKVKDKIIPQIYRMSIDLDSKIKVVHYLGSIDVNYDEIAKSLDGGEGIGQKKLLKKLRKKNPQAKKLNLSN